MTQPEIEKAAEDWAYLQIKKEIESGGIPAASSTLELAEVSFVAGARWAEKSQWISTENSLPRNGQMVLIPMRMGATAAEFNLDSQGKPFWIVWDCPGCIDAERTISLVTHWMPMPGCPIKRKERNKEQEK